MLNSMTIIILLQIFIMNNIKKLSSNTMMLDRSKAQMILRKSLEYTCSIHDKFILYGIERDDGVCSCIITHNHNDLITIVKSQDCTSPFESNKQYTISFNKYGKYILYVQTTCELYIYVFIVAAGYPPLDDRKRLQNVGTAMNILGNKKYVVNTNYHNLIKQVKEKID